MKQVLLGFYILAFIVALAILVACFEIHREETIKQNKIPFQKQTNGIADDSDVWYRVDTRLLYVRSDSGIMVFKFDHLDKNEKN